MGPRFGTLRSSNPRTARSGSPTCGSTGGVYVDLPDLSYDERLAPDEVDHLARRLDIPTEHFWPGFQGFDPPDEETAG